MLDDAKVADLRHHWDAGWNGEDLAVIMEPFADDVVFDSPFAARSLGSTTISGRAALEQYLGAALRNRPGIRYTVESAHAGSSTLVLLYTVHLPDGAHLPGADLMRVGPDGTVVEWRCHYPREAWAGRLPA